MEHKNRTIAWAVGIIAFLCVLMAMKSCNENSRRKQNEKTFSSESERDDYVRDYLGLSDSTSPASGNTKKNESRIVGYDDFGRPIYSDSDVEATSETSEGGEAVPVEYVTNEEGEIVGYFVPIEASSYAEGSEGAPADENAPAGMEITDPPTEAETIDPISGFNHDYSNVQTEPATLPDDFAIDIKAR